MVNTGNKIAIIPARGGSKRIPRKNIVDFHGKPMIAWTIEAALRSECFERVIVSTDDEEIAAISSDYGAESPFLRERYADDHSPVSMVVLETLSRLGITDGAVAMLMANCPLRSELDIRQLSDQFAANEANFQISAFEYGFANPWWAHQTDRDGTAKPLFPEAMRSRSQDLRKLLCPTGACWLARTSHLIEAQTFYGKDYKFAEIGRVAATDIDDFDDLTLARALYLTRSNE